MTMAEEKKKKAVALRYRAGQDNAPVVVAKGTGETARRIIELARENDIPVVEDVELTEALIRIEVFEEIPPVLYEAVAKVLVFVQRIRSRQAQP
jgi:flagellar biosynthesis protein